MNWISFLRYLCKLFQKFYFIQHKALQRLFKIKLYERSIAMFSITHGEVSFDEMCQLIKTYTSQDPNAEFEIAIGTDSQILVIQRFL